VGWCGLDACTSEQAPVAVSCEHDNNESLDSSESRQFIECFRDYEHFKGGFSLWGSLYFNPEQLTMSI